MPQTLIVIRLHDDQPDRDWWTVLGLPHPDRWSTELPQDIYAELVMDVRLAPGE